MVGGQTDFPLWGVKQSAEKRESRAQTAEPEAFAQAVAPSTPPPAISSMAHPAAHLLQCHTSLFFTEKFSQHPQVLMVILGPSSPFLSHTTTSISSDDNMESESSIFSVSTMPRLEPGKGGQQEKGVGAQSDEFQAFCSNSSACRGIPPASAVDWGRCETWALGCTCPVQ